MNAATFAALPDAAAWRHRDAREGFEVVFLAATDGGYQLAGHAAAVEGGRPWAVRYEIVVDQRWVTRSARVWGSSEAGHHERRIDTDGEGRWRVDGAPAPHLDGCADVDLEASACTNTLPVHRLLLQAGEWAEAPAAYVRAPRLEVERLEQQYLRVDRSGEAQAGTTPGGGPEVLAGDAIGQTYEYSAPVFGFSARLVYDAAGLVLDYPGLATRAW